MTALLVCGMGQFVAADEAKDFFKYYSWWEGSWDTEATEGEEVVRGEMVVTRQEPNCILANGGGVSLWGYDPKRKKWVGTGFGPEGSLRITVLERHTGERIRPGTVDHATVTTKNADGSIEKGEATWTYVDDNSYKIVIKRKAQDGEALPDLEWTGTRRKP
jgi:hypothetical protein